MRKLSIAVAVAFALMSASAQAHTATFQASCTTATYSWSKFDTTGSGNGGMNSPHWGLKFWPANGGPEITASGQVNFAGATNTLVETLPAGINNQNGTLILDTWWAASETRDGDVSSESSTFNQTACVKATPKIVTNATVNHDGTLTDTATLSNAVNATGTITFYLYGPSDASCAASPVFASNPVSVNGNGTYASPNAYTPGGAGTYTWVARYSGDGDNSPASDACGEASEKTTVQAHPQITTKASATLPLGGGALNDTATLSGASNPTGTITFNLYSTADTTCASSLFSGSVAVTGNGNYSSPSYTPTAAGTYQWVATYNGDTNNVAASDACNEPAEQTTVQAKPAINTTASGAIVAGGQIQDTAHLTGGTNPTGAITFKLYGPGDSSCATAIEIYQVNVSGDGDYTGPQYTPVSVGTYQWVASYGGDANNIPVSDACNDPAEQTTVTQKQSPAFAIAKLQKIATGTAGYTTQPIVAQVAQTIDYEMQVSNTGNMALSIALVDPHCDAGTLSGPTPALAGGVLAVGQTVDYYCHHVVVTADGRQYINTVTVTATPPGQPPLPQQQATVVANIPVSGVAPFCTASPTLHGPNAGVTKSFTARVSAQGVKSVTFYIDGHKLKTVSHTTGGKFELTINPGTLSYGGHRLTIRVTPTSANCTVSSKALEFVHAKAATINPKFTG